jgi:hypothetical protein
MAKPIRSRSKSITRSPKRRKAKVRRFTSRKNSVAAYYQLLVTRMSMASGGATLKVIGQQTGANAETVRRYMENGRVPAQFLYAFCLAFQVEPKWLLTGEGRQRAR